VGVELALSARIKRKRRRGLELVGEASAAKICGGGDGHQGTEMKQRGTGMSEWLGRSNTSPGSSWFAGIDEGPVGVEEETSAATAI
jgi:hypothetical protein